MADFQKEKFELFMNMQYHNLDADGSFTEEKAGFLRTFVMQAEEDNFDCDNFMWLIAFRNHLTKAASISNYGTVEGLKALPNPPRFKNTSANNSSYLTPSSVIYDNHANSFTHTSTSLSPFPPSSSSSSAPSSSAPTSFNVFPRIG